MCKKLVLAFSLVLLVNLAGTVSAIDWDGGGVGDLWSTALNWAGDVVPTSADFAQNPLGSSTMLIDGTVAAVAADLRVGNEAGPTALDVTGGTLVTAGKVELGFGGGTIGNSVASSMNVSGGTVTVGTNLFVGVFGQASLNVTGGVVNIASFLTLSETSAFGGSGHVQVDGGVITCVDMALKAGGSVDITDGELIYNVLDFSAFATIEELIAAGQVTAFGGAGIVIVTPDSPTAGQTTLSAVLPTRATNPVPANGASVAPSLDTLSWTNPDPNLPGGTVTVDVWLHTTPDVTSGTKIVDNLPVATVSGVVLSPLQTYYWRVDTRDTSRDLSLPALSIGKVWTFNTDNVAPVVDAGVDQAARLTDIVNLDGTITDDGLPAGTVTQLWTVVSGPDPNNVVFGDNTAVDTTATFPVHGTYVLRLTADDSDLTSSDDMQILIATCQDVIDNGAGLVGDVSGPGAVPDCRVDLFDFSAMSGIWLACVDPDDLACSFPL